MLASLQRIVSINTWSGLPMFVGKPWIVLVGGAWSFLFLGCDQSFDPKAPFGERLVVFSILSTARDTQFVRLSTTYDVSGFDPSEHHTDETVAAARVRVIGPYTFHEFTQVNLPRNDTTRYTTTIQAYMHTPFQPEHGAKYDLTVISDSYGTATSSVTIPDPASIGFGLGTSQLDRPDGTEKNSSIGVLALISPMCKGYLTQMFVDYRVLLDSGWIDERIEVPTWILADSLNLWVGTYPSLTRQIVRQTVTSFSVKAYIAALYRVITQHPKRKVTFYRVVGRVLQCEAGLYDYYNTVNGFRDPVSIRLDLPEFSNIRGAKGLFGAYSLDSLTHVLPENFGLNIE
jgi:hypothetical protein